MSRRSLPVVANGDERRLELGKRRARPGPGRGEHLFTSLRSGSAATDVARAHGLPVSHVRGVRTFYDQLHGDLAVPAACVGTACWLASGGARLSPPHRPAHCLGRCFEAPVRSDSGTEGPIPRRSLVEPPVVLRHLLSGSDSSSDYSLPSGEQILEAVTASGLRGRGGAAFPTGDKWRVARDTAAPERVVVANGDEGDPGAYVDRLLLEESPHSVIAGMLACAKAIGAREGVVFIRGEYPHAVDAMSAAIAEARARELLRGFELRIVRGAGSYVAGEESALLRAIEGLRAEPRPKPPYPAERGLFGLPTVVQNIETLSMVPWIVRHARRSDTKAFSVSGAVRAPGVVEAPLGVSLGTLLEQGAGGPSAGARWKMALVGGPMGRVVRADHFDQPLSYDALPGMGHGGVVVLDDTVSVRSLAEHLFAFAASESCGSCTPCRVGTALLSGITEERALERLLGTLEVGSLCGFGQGVPRPIRDLLRSFPGEVLPGVRPP